MGEKEQIQRKKWSEGLPLLRSSSSKFSKSFTQVSLYAVNTPINLASSVVNVTIDRLNSPVDILDAEHTRRTIWRLKAFQLTAAPPQRSADEKTRHGHRRPFIVIAS